MSGQEEIVEIEGKEMVPVDPVNHITSGDNDRHHEYTYSSIHVDEVTHENFTVPTGADFVKDSEDVLVYRYGNRTTVVVTNDGTYIEKGSDRMDGEKQAYFIMSLLDEKGFIGGFRRT